MTRSSSASPMPNRCFRPSVSQLEDPEIVSDGPRLVAAQAEMEKAQERGGHALRTLGGAGEKKKLNFSLVSRALNAPGRKAMMVFSANSRLALRLFSKPDSRSSGSGVHLAGGNLLIRCSVVAEFANSQAIFGADRRSKNATGHGTRFVKFAVSCFRVQRRARLVVRKISKAHAASSPSSNTPVTGSPGKSGDRRATDSRARSRTLSARWGARFSRSARPAASAEHRAD